MKGSARIKSPTLGAIAHTTIIPDVVFGLSSFSVASVRKPRRKRDRDVDGEYSVRARGDLVHCGHGSGPVHSIVQQ